MLRRIEPGPSNPDGLDCVKSLRTVEVPGYRVSEAIYLAAGVVPAQQYERAILCLAIEGGYWMDWGRTRLDCGAASLVLQPPGHVFGAHISHVGSRCLTVAIDPEVLLDDTGSAPDFEHLNAGRRPPPHWLAFQLHQELELADDLTAFSVANTIASLLAELSGRWSPGTERAASMAPFCAGANPGRVRRCHQTASAKGCLGSRAAVALFASGCLMNIGRKPSDSLKRPKPDFCLVTDSPRRSNGCAVM